MTVHSPQCDDTRITRFLQGTLSAAEQRAFELHLDTCSACLEKLEQSTAEPAAWRDAGAFLRDEPTDLEPLSTVLSGGDDSALTRHVLDDGVRRVLDLLAPTDDPQMLGRIGTYEVAGVIGSGGNGIVLKGFDRALNRYVAIKVLAPHLASSGAARHRFAREAQAAAVVVHENVIAIHGVAESRGLPYLVMTYVRGTSLQRRIDDTGPLALIEILRIGTQVAAGLAAAHAQGLVHRDIKPANILLADGVERVTITDFGLARAIDDASMTRSGIIAGTPQFMSPEQARGDGVDHRSDLFSLGSVLYAMCTGHPPFRAETSFGILRRICDSQPRPIRESNPDTPAWLCRLVAKLHEKKPQDRIPTAAEVAELLGQCVAHVQQPDVQELPCVLAEEHPPRTHRRRIGRWALAAGFVVVLLAAIAPWFTKDGKPPADAGRSAPQASQAGQVTAPQSPGPTTEADLRWDDEVSESLLDVKHDVDGLEQRAQQLFSEDESEAPEGE